MKHTALILSVALLAAPAAMVAQIPSFSSSLIDTEASTGGSSSFTPATSYKYAPVAPKPLSRIALGGGVSSLGVNLTASTNLTRYLNLRSTGSTFQYTDNLSTNGFNVSAKINLASAGSSLDFFPFPNHGFRLSPGMLFYNTNKGSGTFTAQGGTSFSLDNYTYYASTSNPVQGVGTLGLNTRKQAFTITTGWGNAIPRKGGHISFPFELGVALTGTPSVNLTLNSGQVCDAQGQNCVDVATDASVQSSLQSQIAKYKNDLSPYSYYPIASFGVAYNFRVR